MNQHPCDGLRFTLLHGILHGACECALENPRHERKFPLANKRAHVELVLFRGVRAASWAKPQLAGLDDADDRMSLFRKLPIEMIPVREPLALEASRIKAQHRVSFADAFAVATARLEHGTILTGDPEILALHREVVRVVKLE